MRRNWRYYEVDGAEHRGYCFPFTAIDGMRPLVLGHYRSGTGAAMIEAFRSITKYGFVQVAGDFGGQTNWGNPTSRALIDDSLNAASAHIGAPSNTPYWSLAVSMGASGILGHALDNLDRIRAIAMVAPFVGLKRARDSNFAGWAAEMNAAYGGAAAFDAAMPTHDPILIAPLLSSVPIAVWYSPADLVAQLSELQLFVDAHGNTTLHELPPVDHASVLNFDVLDQDEIAEFLLTYDD